MLFRRSILPESRGLVAALMSAPVLLGLLLFVALPFLLAVALGFSNLRLGSPLPLEWVGLEQYHRIFSDPSFIRALANNLLFALVQQLDLLIDYFLFIKKLNRVIITKF